ARSRSEPGQGRTPLDPPHRRQEVDMKAFFEDVRYCVRSLRRTPGFTLVVILTLGLGVGFNTAIYSVVNSFILRPLPVKDPDQLVILAARETPPEAPPGSSSPAYRHYRNLTGLFSAILARREFHFAANWRRIDQTERLWVDAVTVNYYDLLGVAAALGRTFLPAESRQP